MPPQGDKKTQAKSSDAAAGINHYGSTGGDESTSLVPSPVSNGKTSMNNVLISADEENDIQEGLIKRTDSRSFEMQSCGGSMQKEKASMGSADPIHTRRRGIICVSVVLAAALGLLCVWYITTHPRSPTTTANPTGELTQLKALSILDPVADLGLPNFPRSAGTTPPPALSGTLTQTDLNKRSYPTNSWYQNLLLLRGEPSETHRVYTAPYVLDLAGPIPGVRILPNQISASTTIVQLNLVTQHGITLGAMQDSRFLNNENPSHTVDILRTTPLGLTLKWKYFPMVSSIVKGMPYVTMKYEKTRLVGADNQIMIPSIASEIGLAENPVVDQSKSIRCTTSNEPFLVNREIKLFFAASDFTWLVFVSEPVLMQCVSDSSGGFKMQVTGFLREPNEDRPLYMRIALMEICSSGQNPSFCHQEQLHPNGLLIGQGNYANLIRSYAPLFPGENTTFTYEIDDKTKIETMKFNWDMQNMSNSRSHIFESNRTITDLITFALPHHFDLFGNNAPVAGDALYCARTLSGAACLLKGNTWDLHETIPDVSFWAPRPPVPWAIGAIVSSLHEDIQYRLPDVYIKGSGDTYFSGKMLAKLARILVITKEMADLCRASWAEASLIPFTAQVRSEYDEACSGLQLPTEREFTDALAALRSSTEVWLNGTAEVPFVYDPAWGGVVWCGCLYDGVGCKNKFPNCPAFSDPGLNFGNAYYNDQHFHYGYHIYAAAVVSYFDHEWGRNFFERVMLLVRSIANPSDADEYFTLWRHMDWYQGHSWASGISSLVLNGRNQESSSEAIAGYEAVALYGKVMITVWESSKEKKENADAAKDIRNSGLALLAAELRSAKRYYHVSQANKALQIYPSEYTAYAIGMLWQTMAQLQTWFGGAQYLAYGIQLLPITAISEQRDSIDWVMEMYHTYARSCEEDSNCKGSGWAIMELTQLATVGHPQLASEKAGAMPSLAFEDSGGNGHSLSNTLWYIATRPSVSIPLPLSGGSNGTQGVITNSSVAEYVLSDCYRPEECTDYVLDTIAGIYTCRQRIQWLITVKGMKQIDACSQVAGEEYPSECGLCDPLATASNETAADIAAICPPCSDDVCKSKLNNCPSYERTFVCADGPNTGGCSRDPWLDPVQCTECCELSSCPEKSSSFYNQDDAANCPLCDDSVCKSPINRCPRDHAPFLCSMGRNVGGCSDRPWSLEGGLCTSCCTVGPTCGQ